MNILPAALLALVSLAFPFANALAQSDQSPPEATIVMEDFSPMRAQWQPVSGTWAVGNGTYGSSSAGATDISTITSYRGVHPADPSTPDIGFPEWFIRARVRNQGFDDTHHVGIVYGYQDSQNYYEVIISAVGHLRIRTVMNGVAVDERDAVLTGIPRNQWCELQVRWKQGVTTVKINGQSILPVSQPEFTRGQVGFVTHAAVGRFDSVFLGTPFGDQPFFETFTQAPFVEFTPQSGQWSVVNDMLKNTSVQQTSINLAPITTGFHPQLGDTFDHMFRARLLNGYAGPGNLVGIVFNYQFVQYTEVVFSPTGVAKLNRFENGVVRTIATASYDGSRNVPFDVTLENGPSHFAIIVDGKNLFPDVSVFDVNPGQVPEGGVGLITHWAPGRFDNIKFTHGAFQPCSYAFGQLPPFSRIVSGAWNTNGGTLNSTSVGPSDIVSFACSNSGSPGVERIYRARLLNEFGASGNLVGLVYDYQDFGLYAGDYFEVVLSPTGIMRLNKVIQGVRYLVRSRTHTIPRNTWFNVQVIRNDIFTTVKLNGVTVLENEPQGDLQPGGSIGAITHWTRGRFDNVSVTERIVSPP